MTVLIITSSAGGGHMSGAKAMEEKLIRENASEKLHFTTKDLLRDWLPKWIGRFKTNMWNRAQAKGDIPALNWMAAQQGLIDILLAFPVFLGFFFSLRKYRPNRVIDTQPLSTKTLIRAIRLYNYIYKKALFLEKVITDPPSKKAEHFFPRIKKLSAKNRKYIQITAMAPIVEQGESVSVFWEKHTNLPIEQITTIPFLVRQGFFPYLDKPRENAPFVVPLSYDSSEEKMWLQDLAKKATNLQMQQHTFSLSLESSDILITILLGLRPPKHAVLSYIRSIVEACSHHPQKNIYCVVCCGKNRGLQKMIREHFGKEPYARLLVLPVTNQDASSVGALFHRSDINCTKSGGQTTMELLAVATGKICIHSEQVKGTGNATLLQGIPCWEADNAEYLVRKKQATVVNPAIFADLLHHFFGQLNTKAAHPNLALANTALPLP